MQLIFLRKIDCLGCVVALACCLFDLACFFLPSFSSLIETYMYIHDEYTMHFSAPGDYTQQTITITREQLVTSFEVTIQVEDDRILERRETFLGQLQLTQESLDLGVVTLGQSVGEVTITDNDGMYMYMYGCIL